MSGAETEALVARLRKLSAYGCCLEAAVMIEEFAAQRRADDEAAEAAGYTSCGAAISSMVSIIRQAARDTFGNEELLPKEFADESGYDS